VDPNLGKYGPELYWALKKEDHLKAPWRPTINSKNKKTIDLSVWQRKQEGAPNDYLRIHIYARNTTVDEWFEVLKDGPPIKNAKVREVVRTVDSNHKYIRIQMSLPIMTDREIVIEWKRI
jgi:hypothetical protein